MSKAPEPRDTQFSLRLDAALLRQARDKAQAYGGLAVVIRAMLRAFIRGELVPPAADLDHELTSAPVVQIRKRQPQKPRQPASRKRK